MAGALDVRVSTSRQQQPQTIEQPLRRLRDPIALPPDWPGAEESSPAMTARAGPPSRVLGLIVSAPTPP